MEIKAPPLLLLLLALLEVVQVPAVAVVAVVFGTAVLRASEVAVLSAVALVVGSKRAKLVEMVVAPPGQHELQLESPFVQESELPNQQAVQDRCSEAYTGYF